MICEDYSSRRRLREACYSLVTIAIGFISCSTIAILAYYTYQAMAGNNSYCSLWTDIPGRLALFLTFYYAAGICGVLPIPECFRVNWLPPPFVLYRRESWRNLLRNLCLFFTCNYEGYEALEDDPEMSPPRYESKERDYDCQPTPTSHEKSKNIQISETVTPKQSIVRPNKAGRHRDVENASSSEDCSMSFDSPIAGQIVPMVKGKSSKPRYIPDSSISTSESTGKSLSVDTPSDKLYKLSETLNDRFKAVAGLSDETDTPPRTPEVELRLPSYPRRPWGYYKNGSGVPYEAKALHRRNLMTEKREISKFNKKQKVEETTCSQKDSECSWITDSDEFKPFANRPLRPPLIPIRPKAGFRGRTITAPGSIRKLGKMKTKIHKRICSCSPPHRYRPYTAAQMSPGDNFDTNTKDKCCESSSDIQTKTKHIQKTLMKFDPNFQTGASTSRQSDDFPRNTSNSNTGDEASTSRQNIVFPSKISNSNIDAEASVSRRSIGFFPSNISNSNTGGESSISRQNIDVFPSELSNSNVDSEASTSRQNIVFPSKISNSNVDAEASASRQRIGVFPNNIFNSNTGDEASTSRQNIDVFPSKLSNSNVDAEASASGQSTGVFSSNISNSSTDSEASISRQNVHVFSSKISDSNVDAEISASRQNTDAFSSKTSDSKSDSEA